MTIHDNSLQRELWELIRAGFSGIWIETQEPNEALLEISSLASEHGLAALGWNLDAGLRTLPSGEKIDEAADPLAAVRMLPNMGGEQSTVLVLENFHLFVDSPDVCQAILTQITLGKQLGRHLVILSPVVSLPKELERQFVVIQHRLPDREQLWTIAEGLNEESAEYAEEDKRLLLDASVGLTHSEAESAFSLSLVRNSRLLPEEIWELKASWLAKSGLLSLYRGGLSFDSLGGLQNLKQFCTRSLLQSSASLAHPRGVMLLGVPGTGKSAFAKALGNHSGRPVLSLDIGKLMGSLVGQTEANIRTALATADAMAPCILFIDEVEKALSGANSGGRGDSGTSSRLFGTLLTWLNDHESDVYVVVTCNNIEQLPPEFSRAERFDAILFLDLPDRDEKDAIWELYTTHYELEVSQSRPSDESWSGAEIKACCRLACLLNTSLQEAASYIVPIGKTAEENVQRLRSWASGRCLSASHPGIYKGSQEPAAQTRRRRGVSVRPSVN